MNACKRYYFPVCVCFSPKNKMKKNYFKKKTVLLKFLSKRRIYKDLQLIFYQRENLQRFAPRL